ncbi:unnamed protein product [Triticum turgidum subsp. durum]|uniref:TAZ-type domain-containing protein n=1 Tax=Triticum turgidum subsp. durum TaxID=4567 RepID=A0A9R1PT57_TRITD|nr:unnamed protein product [Triticum turgidum subsp. durum]
MIDRARRGWGADCTIRVLGVSFDAVRAFLHFLYSSKVAPEEEELVGAHGAQLLTLAHAYRVGWLKRAAEAAVSARLTPERAVDMLKLARLCDARRLYLRCADGAVCADTPCAKAGCTCRGLQLLMRHFATCAKKAAPGGCARCKRMLQLFRLHASVCDRPDKACRVPLCR